MANLQVAAPAISAPAAPPYTITTTRPDELLRHDISDEELGILFDMKRDHIWKGMWVALGLGVGAAPAAFAAIRSSFWTQPPAEFTAADLIQVILCVVGLAVGGVLSFVMRNKGRDARDLGTAIRERTKQRV